MLTVKDKTQVVLGRAAVRKVPLVALGDPQKKYLQKVMGAFE